MDNIHIIENKQIRKPNLLKGHDYSRQGAYFVTICTNKMAHLFGQIENFSMIPNKYGLIIREEWFRSSVLREYIELHEDEFTLMPNHIHAIVWIMENEMGSQFNQKSISGPRSRSLGAIIGQFKSRSSRRVNMLRNLPGKSIWQRNYYDHIIRNDQDLYAIRKYILENPYKWEEEKEFPGD